MGCFKLRNGAELSLLTSIEQHTIVVLSNKHDAFIYLRRVMGVLPGNSSEKKKQKIIRKF